MHEIEGAHEQEEEKAVTASQVAGRFLSVFLKRYTQ